MMRRGWNNARIGETKCAGFTIDVAQDEGGAHTAIVIVIGSLERIGRSTDREVRAAAIAEVRRRALAMLADADTLERELGPAEIVRQSVPRSIQDEVDRDLAISRPAASR